ncbi:MAG: YfcC family protein, partial [Clostridiales bacterium]|nr:YfcC family protein [Clostridiales bacterium]
MKRFKMPTAYTIMLIIIIVMAILTWIIPAGAYEYTPDSGEPITGSYHQIAQNPQGIGDIVLAPIQGFIDAIEVSTFILMVGGFLGIVMQTGAINAGIGNIIHAFRGREKLMIPLLMILFSLGGTSFGMAEETLAFYPILLPVFIAAGYDSMTAIAVVLVGAGIGVLGSTVNPFATGIASGFVGVSIGDGILLRILILIAMLIISIIYTMRYGERVRKDPTTSVVYHQYEDNKKHFTFDNDGDTKVLLTDKQKVSLTLFILTFLVMIYAV